MNLVCYLRSYLKEGDTIELKVNPAESHSLSFKILDFIGEGGSSVCYYAEHNGICGRLKELYPTFNASTESREFKCYLPRNNKNQLYPLNAMQKGWLNDAIKDNVQAYTLLEKIRNSNSEHQVLNNYLPNYQLLYGYDPENKDAGTLYVWTPNDKFGKIYKEYLSEIHKNANVNPEQKLSEILDVMISLSECVCALHNAGLLHMDLKPSNFMVLYDGMKNIEANDVFLFDINSLTHYTSLMPRVAGTHGYKAPEVSMGKADNRTDIFSLGAVLFRSIIVSENIKTYDIDYYEDLESILMNSTLFKASKINSDKILCNKLVEILKTTLAYHRQERYGSCEELLIDLERAKKRLDYLMAINMYEDTEEKTEYIPNPIDTKDVELPENLIALTEKIAENVHEVWAQSRISQGWTYGEKRDDNIKTTPCLVPYSQLSEEEKDYDRNTAMETIKLIIALGYKIEE